jgi:NAD(P)H dehydrogenase (quinone)
MGLIAVTGASGKLGRATITFLLDRNVPATDIVAVVRDPAKVADLAGGDVQVRRGDYTDPALLESAFRGVEQLLFISTSALGEERMLHHRNVVRAARAAGVKHILYTSVVSPSPTAKFAASPGHFHTEALIRESGITYTFFRNNLYLDIAPFMFGSAVATGTLAYPAGSGRIGFIARDDIAEALAAVLTQGEHANREYPITVSHAPYSLHDIAAALGKAAGKTVSYSDVTPEVFRATLEKQGLPPPAVAMTVGLAEAVRAGEFDAASPELERFLGRPPVGLEAFLRKALAPRAS